MAAGALVGGTLPLLFDGSLTATVLVGASFGVVYLVVAAVLAVERRPARAESSPVSELRRVARTAAATVRRTVAVRALLGLAFAFGIALSAVEILWQPRMAHLVGGNVGDHTALFGLLTAAGMLLVGAGAFLSPRLAGRTTARLAYAAGIAAAAAFVALLAAAGSVPAFAAAYLALYLTIGALDPLHNEILHTSVGSRARATMASVDSLALQGGAAVGNLAIAALAASAGITLAWLVAASGVALACGLCRFLPAVAGRTERVVAPAPPP